MNALHFINQILTTITRRSDDPERGASMVEFAIVLPLVVTLVAGTVAVGRLHDTQVVLRSAARNGARTLALGADPATTAAAVARSAPFTIDQVSLGPCPASGGGDATVTLAERVDVGVPFLGLGTRTVRATGVMPCPG